MTASKSKSNGLTKSQAFNMAIVAGVLVLLLEPNGLVGRRLAEWRSVRDQSRRVSQSWEAIVARAARDEDNAAPIAIVEVIDYECPFCRNAHTIVSDLQRAEPELGVGFLHFPLEEIHPKAKLAATYAICAEQQGRFGAAHRYLLEDAKWIDDDTPDTVIATQIGVSNSDKFIECLDAPTTEQTLNDHRDLAERIGVQATPSLITPKALRQGAFNADVVRHLMRR